MISSGTRRYLILKIISQSITKSSTVGRFTYVVAPDIDLWQPIESVAIRTGLDYLLQGEIHPSITAHQMSVQCFPILELDKHGVALCGIEQAKGKLPLLISKIPIDS